MLRFASKIIMWCYLLTITLSPIGCSYEKNYREYALSQASIAASAGPLVKIGPNGMVTEIGNPMIPLIAMQQKPPKSELDSVFDFLTAIGPFGAIWGIVGSMANSIRGNTTNVTGNSNLTGNTAGSAGGASSWASPVTTTTTTTVIETITEGQ
jgi:hypothetical protein